MDEHALIRGLQERREESATVFLRRYRAPLLHCIARFERDAGLREDLYQELAAHLVEELAAGRYDASRGSLGAWVYRVAWCRCVDRRRRRPPVEGAGSGDAIERLETADPGPGPATRVEDEETGALVRRALAELPAEEADLIRRRHLEGLSMAEVAERGGLSLETAKYRLKQAMIRLRGRLLALGGPVEVGE